MTWSEADDQCRAEGRRPEQRANGAVEKALHVGAADRGGCRRGLRRAEGGREGTVHGRLLAEARRGRIGRHRCVIGVDAGEDILAGHASCSARTSGPRGCFARSSCSDDVPPSNWRSSAWSGSVAAAVRSASSAEVVADSRVAGERVRIGQASAACSAAALSVDQADRSARRARDPRPPSVPLDSSVCTLARSLCACMCFAGWRVARLRRGDVNHRRASIASR